MGKRLVGGAGVEVFDELGGGGVALGGVVVAGFEDDVVELGELGGGVVDFGVVGTVFAGGHFVENFAEGVKVGGGFAGAFARDVAKGADEGLGGVGGGDEADVGEAGLDVDVEDVARFDVAVDEVVVVEMPEGGGNGASGGEAFGHGQGRGGLEPSGEGVRVVVFGVDVSTGVAIIGARHDVIEGAGGFVMADLKDVDDAFVFAGNGLEAPDAFQFAFVRADVFEAIAVDDFYGAEFVQRGAGEPDFAVAAPADAAE